MKNLQVPFWLRSMCESLLFWKKIQVPFYTYNYVGDSTLWEKKNRKSLTDALHYVGDSTLWEKKSQVPYWYLYYVGDSSLWEKKNHKSPLILRKKNLLTMATLSKLLQRNKSFSVLILSRSLWRKVPNVLLARFDLRMISTYLIVWMTEF